MREDEGRKLLKARMVEKIIRVRNVVHAKESDVYRKVNSLLQKVRYKKYVLTKSDMTFLNKIYELFTRKQ
jgi:hypothetical protein